MKKTLTFLVALVLTGALAAQQYEFTTIVKNPHTEAKHQAYTGTCWCFATISLLESEIIRMGKAPLDLSVMFTVRNVYKTRYFDNYLRRGQGNLGPGSLAHTATRSVAKYGLVPLSVYPGINYDSEYHNHTELQGYIDAMAEVPIKVKNYSPQADLMLEAALDIYLGEAPETFVYEGKEHTPLSFVKYLGLDMDDYVEIVSCTHHPFYQQVPFEVPDNWNMRCFTMCLWMILWPSLTMLLPKDTPWPGAVLLPAISHRKKAWLWSLPARMRKESWKLRRKSVRTCTRHLNLPMTT